ncbi:hypothetical protein [Bacillus wiedmannii]|nr:hypothetical protein [Bacillus wiedmannii]
MRNIPVRHSKEAMKTKTVDTQGSTYMPKRCAVLGLSEASRDCF